MGLGCIPYIRNEISEAWVAFVDDRGVSVTVTVSLEITSQFGLCLRPCKLCEAYGSITGNFGFEGKVEELCIRRRIARA